MGAKIINIRGYTFSVEAKSGTQLDFIKRQMEERTDEQLREYQMEYDKDIIRSYMERLRDGGPQEHARPTVTEALRRLDSLSDERSPESDTEVPVQDERPLEED